MGGGGGATRREELRLHRLATAIPCHHNNDHRVSIGMTNVFLDIGDPLASKNLGLCLWMFDSINVKGISILGTLVPTQENEEGQSH